MLWTQEAQRVSSQQISFTTISKITREIFVKISPTWTWNIIQMSCLYASDFPVKNFCKLAQRAETMRKKMLGKRVMKSTLVDKSTDTINHISICVFFYRNMNVKINNSFQNASWNWRKQRSTDSYRQWQISQSDFEISYDCGKLMKYVRMRSFDTSSWDWNKACC